MALAEPGRVVGEPAHGVAGEAAPSPDRSGI